MEQGDSGQRRDYWAIELQQWVDSGLSGLRYCKENKLSYNRFAYWRKKLAIQSKPVSKSHANRSGFAKVISIPAQQLPTADSSLTMTLPNGITLQGIREEHVKLIGLLLRQL